MRIGLQAWGSEGDIRPFIALGHGLARRGHDVELVYTDFEDRHFESLAQSLGFRARPIATPVASHDEMTRIGHLIMKARDPLTQSRVIVDRLFNPVSEPLFAAATDLCRRSDLVVGHFFVHQLQAASELARVPHVTVTFTHNLVPSRTMTPTGLPHLGEWANALGWRLARFAVNRTVRADVNRFRSRLGLRLFDDVMTQAWTSQRLNLITVSPTICQRARDWPPQHRVCGFLAMTANQNEAIPDEVHAFLNDGPPPVFMGFGSLMPTDRNLLDQTVSIFREAAARASARAVIHLPQGSHLQPGRDGHVLMIGRVSHAALFPMCTAIVHHGGAGTTHTALAAGVPSIVVPHVADQYFWADELRRIGVALKPVSRRPLSARTLSKRIRATAENPILCARAAEIGQRVRAEDGVGVAVELIEGSPA